MNAADLRREADVLAGRLTRRHFERFPDLAERYGDYGRRRCLEDAQFHISFLAAALDAGLDSIFYDYVEWTKTVLVSRGVTEADLVENLRSLSETLTSQFGPERSRAATDLVARAIDLLPSMPADVPSFIDPSAADGDVAAAYLKRLIEGKEQAANREIANAIERGVSMNDICTNVLELVQREVGRLWQLNRISVAVEHFCTAVTQRTITQVCGHRAAQHGGDRKRVLAMCVPGEQHEIGLRIITDLLALEGWQTYFLGPNVPATAAAQMCVDRKIDVLLLSASLPPRIAATKEVIKLVRENAQLQRLRIIVGGLAFRNPEAWRVTGADAFAANTKAAVELLRN